MNQSFTNTKNVKRREFLKSTGLVIGTALTGLDFPQQVLGQSVFDAERFTQKINEVRLYMTHYAFFEEPDSDIAPALYFDALTGQSTNDLALIPPIGQRTWFRPDSDQSQLISTKADYFKPNLPYKLGRGNAPDFQKL